MKCKSLFSFVMILIVFTALCGSVTAEEYPEPERSVTDNLTWEFDKESGTLAIHGSGPMRSYMSNPPEWEEYKDEIRKVTLEEGITSVGECAFYNYGNLEKVLLPDSIEVVDQFAFYYCWELRTISVPANLRYVGRMAFYNTLLHDPVDIIFPEGTEYIGEEAFHSAMKTDGKYVIPSTVRFIGDCAFSNAFVSAVEVSEENAFYKSEEGVLLTKDGTELMMYPAAAAEASYCVPDGVVKIHEEAFNVTLNLKKLFIPASVTQIEDAAIFSTFNLSQIEVEADNTAYKIDNGALCTIDGKTYLAYPDGISIKEIVIPEGVERIAPYVFYGRSDSKVSVILPQSIKTIGEMSMPMSVSSITIPVGIETIEPYAFCYEGGVDEVCFEGSDAEWQNVNIGEGNRGLESAAIRYGE